MTISLKHAFQSAKGDPPDTTLVRPSNWNAEHTLTMATAKVLGRATSGTGAAEELDCTAFGRSLLAADDLAAFLAAAGFGGFTTGDAKLTLKTTADAGWVLANDSTIGDASSGASYADDDAEDLFLFLHGTFSNSICAVSGGRGASAAADWSAHKTIALTKVLGRALVISGTGSGLTARTHGATFGAETTSKTILQTNLPDVDFTITATTDSGGTIARTQNGAFTAVAGGSTALAIPSGQSAADDVSVTGTAASGGSGTAMSIAIVQPSAALNVMIKL